MGDVLAASQAEDADNRPARQTFLPELTQLLMGLFVGPETLSDELANEELLDRIRKA